MYKERVKKILSYYKFNKNKYNKVAYYKALKAKFRN